MSRVFIISDLHLGHDKVLEFSPSRGGSTTEEHDQWLIDQWNSVVGKRDTVWVLGDVAFSRQGLAKLSQMRGNKKLILGNHDKFSIEEYQQHFSWIGGLVKRKGLWLSHAPIYITQLRGCINVHGHVHSDDIPDRRYVNVCVEACDGVPIEFTKILEQFK